MSAVKQAYAPVELLLRQAMMVSLSERRAYLELARSALGHPALAPFHVDPLYSDEGLFLSLDMQARAVEQALAHVSPKESAVGGCWGALYLPAENRARACRVWAAVDWAQKGTWGWPDPVSVIPLAPEVSRSAQTALAAALAVVESSCLSCPWISPAPLYFMVEGAQEARGDSLTLPLALAFLSALTRLPLPANLGATGTIHEGRIGAVGWLSEKRAALLSQGIQLAEPPESASVAELAASTLLGGEGLLPKVVDKVRQAPAVLSPTLFVADLELDPLLWGTNPPLVRQIISDFEARAHQAIASEGGYLYRRRAGGDEGIRAVFVEPKSACRAACALQKALKIHLWPSSHPVVLARIGIHRGPAERVEDGYFGPAPRLAVHLMQAAAPGQILLTTTVAEALSSEALAPIPLGLYRLRELSLVLPLFRLEGEGVPRAMPVESDSVPLCEAEGIAALALAMGLVVAEDRALGLEK